MSEPRPYWQPWTPRVGQRVRVRLSGECAARQHHHDTDARRVTLGPGGHYATEEGREGVIVACTRQLCAEWRRDHWGHGVHVIYDEPFEIELADGSAAKAIGQAYAAIELEPLEEVPE